MIDLEKLADAEAELQTRCRGRVNYSPNYYNTPEMRLASAIEAVGMLQNLSQDDEEIASLFVEIHDLNTEEA